MYRMARSLEGGATNEGTKNGSKAPRAATAPPLARKINVCLRECPETRFFRDALGIATFDTQLSSGLQRWRDGPAKAGHYDGQAGAWRHSCSLVIRGAFGSC